jgi:hypothetical protein
MSNLLDTLVTIVIVAALIVGARAYFDGDLAMWVADNVPAAVSFLPDSTPGLEAAERVAAERTVETIADTAVSAVADVADAVIPGSGQAVENLSDWVIPDLPSVATTVAESTGATLDAVLEPGVVVDEQESTALAEPPEPATPKATGQTITAQPIAPANQARPIPQPVVITVYQRYNASAFVGLAGHVKAAGLTHARVIVSYPDGVNQEVTIYADGRVVSKESRAACPNGAGFCLSADSGLVTGS